MRRSKLILSLVCVVIGAANSGVARAQWQASADLGLAHLQQRGIPETTAPTFGLDLAGMGDRSSLDARVLSTTTSAGGWTGQALAIGALHGAATALPQWALTGVASTFAASNEGPTVSGELLAQLRFGSAERGADVGLGGGGLTHRGHSAPLGQVEGDVWTSVAKGRLFADVSYVATRALNDVNPLRTSPPRLSYVDVNGRWQRDWRGLSLGASGGVRSSNDRNTGTWASADGTMWITDRAALVLGAGRALDDPVRGVPATRFATVAVRLTSARQQAVLNRPVSHGPTVTVAETSDGRREIAVRGVTGARVEVMGDFTDWNPVSLDRTGAVWTTDRAVRPGLHRMAIRIDGGEWTVPANLPRVPDELGGVVGLITIP